MIKFKFAAINATLIVIAILPLQKLAAQEINEENTNTVNLGYIYVDNPNGKFGEYNGLDKNNNHLILNMDSFQRNDEAPEQYRDLNIHNLGLATFSVQGEQGIQGNYKLRAGYDQIQKVYHGDAQTIYDDDLKTLPEPRDIDTRVKRKTVNLGLDKFLPANWELKTDLRSENKEGQRSRPTNRGLIVPQNIDFNHSEFEASLTHATDKMQWELGSYFSSFSNANDLILATSAEPDNTFYKLSVNGGGAINNTSRITGSLAYSNGKQNDDFSRYEIADGTYATNSLNAEFGMINARLNYRNRLTRKLNIDVNYRLEKRNNNTPLYSDFPNEKNNKAYDWNKQKLDIKMRYRLPKRWRLRGGLQLADYQYEVNKSPRSTGRLPEQAARLVDDTYEPTAWAQIRMPVLKGFYGNLKYARSDRDVDLDPVRMEAATLDTGGVAISTYLVPRVRDKIDLLVGHSLNQNLSTGLNFSVIKDDYNPVSWASIDSSGVNRATLDVTYSEGPKYSVNVYAGIEKYDIKQSGFGSLGNASSRWEYETNDKSDLFGVTGKFSAFSGKVDFSLNYNYQQGNAQYETFDPSEVSGAFPDLKTNINTLTLKADIVVSRDFVLNVSYLYEDYSSDSWVWKNGFDTLNYGYDSPNYASQLIMFDASYRF